MDQEDSDTWRAFLVDLKSRGLAGKLLKMITTDGSPGLTKALKEIHPFLAGQRYIVHKLRNIVVKMRHMHMQPCMMEAEGTFTAASRREAIKRFKHGKRNGSLRMRERHSAWRMTCITACSAILFPKSSERRYGRQAYWSDSSGR